MNAEPDSVYNPRANQYAIFASVGTPVHDVQYFLMDNNIDYQVLLGAYKGEKETSYIIPYDRLEDVMHSGLLNNEESILILDAMDGLGRRKAHLHLLTTNEVFPIGYLKATARLEAETGEGWSYNPSAKQFFTIVDIEEATQDQA